MLWARSMAVLVLGAIGTGCAAKSAGPACSREADMTYGFAVYNACAVNAVARPVGTAPRINYSPSGRQTCMSAVIEYVVDASGTARPETAKIVRTNDMGYANAYIAAVGGLKYTPARKDGMSVAQLVRIEPKAVIVLSRSPAPPTRAAARSAGSAC